MFIKVILKLKGLGLWGAGKETFEADVITFKTKVFSGITTIAIPGSYIKGLLRSWAYKIAPLLSKEKLISASINPMCCVKEPCKECIVCKVFGASGEALSPLEISNFYSLKADVLSKVKGKRLEELLQEDDIWEAPRVLYLPHVRIYDLTMKASEGGLFTQEIVHPGTLFLGEIRLYENLLGEVNEADARLLLILSLAQLNYSYVGRRTKARVRVIAVSYTHLTLPTTERV